MYLFERHWKRRARKELQPPMCYTRRDQNLEREARRVTESRLMQEEARHRQEEHRRRREREEKPPSEKVKEMVSTGR